MNNLRRALVVALAALGCAVAGAQTASAYPVKPIKIVVPFPPGGTTDVLARMLGQRMTAAWGQPVVVENKAGAGATIGADFVAKSPADGYTLLMGAAHHTIAQNVYSKLPYHLGRDFVPVSVIAMVPNMVVVNAAVPAKTIEEFVALAKSQPGKLNYGTAGAGTAHHLIGEMFKLRAGVDLMHVPYKGSAPAVSDLVGGQVQVMFDTVTSGLPQVKGGKTRALAVTTPALHRLERRGLISSEWGPSEKNRRARHYQLTPLGRQRYRDEADQWARYAEMMDRVLRYGATGGIRGR